jgi:hypothetical protein
VKTRYLCTACILLSAMAKLPAQPPPQPPAPPCEPTEQQICGQQAPEDLVALGPQWVAASAMSGAGGIRLIETGAHSASTIYPSRRARHEHDTATYPDCPGPPDPANFTTHGLYVDRGTGPVYRLMAVGHGARESIEVFDIDTRTPEPTATWVGCVVAPEPIGLNSVRGLPDGGFITTNFLPRNSTPEETQAMLAGAQNGELWEWHTDSGWSKVPGSEAAGANGVELSADGQMIYVAAWGSQSFFRVTRGWDPPRRDDIDLGFRVDNIHWARDGTLYAVGQAGQRWVVVSIDPDTLQTREVLSRPDTEAFGAGTALVEVGDDYWVGSFRGNRIAVVPAP